MDWNLGYSASFYASVVDPLSWREIERFEITGGKISRSDSDLMESADIECVSYPQRTERWVRILLDAKQNGASSHTPLFTGLATSPSKNINGTLFTNSVQCYSALKPAGDILLPRGWYAPVGIIGGLLVKNLLTATPAPVVVEDGSPDLKNAIIAENGESNLSMAWKILKAINWRLRIDGYGVITVCPNATEEVRRFDSADYDSIEPVLKVTEDWYSCPNVFRAIEDDLTATARDDSEDSFLSTVNRGREIWKEESNCDLNENETVAEYAMRRLKEEQAVAYSVSYDRRYDPSVLVSDLVRMNYPAQGIEGLFKVVSQTVSLGYGCKTAEEVRKV